MKFNNRFLDHLSRGLAPKFQLGQRVKRMMVVDHGDGPKYGRVRVTQCGIIVGVILTPTGQWVTKVYWYSFVTQDEKPIDLNSFQSEGFDENYYYHDLEPL